MFRLFAALVIFGTFLSAAPFVSADEPTAVYNDRECINFISGMSWCTWMRLVQHTSTQPDGDQSTVYHFDVGEELIGPMGVESSESTSDDVHTVFVDDVLQEMHYRSVYDVVLPGFACQFETFYQYANGEFRIERNEMTGDCL